LPKSFFLHSTREIGLFNILFREEYKLLLGY